MTRYHVDWNQAGYQLCTDSACEEEFHSDSKIECCREYDRVVLPVYQRQGFDMLPPVWTKDDRPPRS